MAQDTDDLDRSLDQTIAHDPEPEPAPEEQPAQLPELSPDEQDAIIARNQEEVDALLAATPKTAGPEPVLPDEVLNAPARREPEISPEVKAAVDDALAPARPAREDHEPEAAPKVDEVIAKGEHAMQKVEAKATVAEAAAPAHAEVHEDAKGGDADEAAFLEAIAQNETGGRGKGQKGHVELGAGTIGAAGFDASYGRYQTTADKAVGVLKRHPEEAEKLFHLTRAELADLGDKMNATRAFWETIVNGSPQHLGRGKKAIALTRADHELARTDPTAFCARWGATWHDKTGLAEADLRHMIACIKIKELVKKKYKDKDERREAAHRIYDDNKAFFDELGMQPKDLTTFLKGNNMKEHLGGFHFLVDKAAGGKLHDATCHDAGETIGRLELQTVREQVEAAAQARGVAIQDRRHLWMLCAKAHNAGPGKLTDDNFRDPSTLEQNDYVAKFLAHYGAAKAGTLPAARPETPAARAHVPRPTAKQAPDPAKTPAAPAQTQRQETPAPWWKFWGRHGQSAAAPPPKLSWWDRALGRTVADKLKARGLEIGKRIGAREITAEAGAGELLAYDRELEGQVSPMAEKMAAILRAAARDPKLDPQHTPLTTPAPDPRQDPKQAMPVHEPIAPMPHAGAARHDGGHGQRLGEGDEVFDDRNQVIQAFPTTPEGVVEAAFYELHRGDKRGLDEIMADQSKHRIERGEQAALGGGEKYGAYTDHLEHVQTVGHQTKYQDKFHPDLVLSGNAVGPIQAYMIAGGFSPYLKRLGSAVDKDDKKNERKMWCGNFVTFVYARAGIRERSFAMASDAAMIDAAFGGQYFDVHDGEYGEGHVLDDPKLKKAKLDNVRKQMSHDRKQLTSLAGLDIRPGDHFHTGKHTGLVVGVKKSARRIDLVTIEGNMGDKVGSRHRVITLDDAGKVDMEGIQEWARPPQFAGGKPVAATDGEGPEWLKDDGKKHGHGQKKKKGDENPDTNWM